MVKFCCSEGFWAGNRALAGGYTNLGTMISTKMDSCRISEDVGLSDADGLPANLADEVSTEEGLLFRQPTFSLPAFSSEENPFLFPLDLMSPVASFQTTELERNLHDVSGEVTPSWVPDSVLDTGLVWWLLHTKPRQEKKLAEQLAKLEIPHFLPVTQCRAITRGRTRITWSPLFSGYFFLRGTPAQRLRALETNRIVATHRVDDSEGLRERLWELANLIEKGAPLTAEARLATGRRVRVKSGSFQNMEGTVIKRGGKTRLFILVNQLLGGVSMEIEEHLLEPIF